MAPAFAPRPSAAPAAISVSSTSGPSLIRPRQTARLSALSGSVRARASKYDLCSRTSGDVPSRGFQDGQHRHGAAEELEPAAIGGNVLVVAGVRAEEVAEFIVCATEPGGRSRAFEAPHGPVAAFDAPMILLQPVVQVGTGS